MGRVSFPAPGDYIVGGGQGPQRASSSDGGLIEKPPDPRVEWLQNVRNQLNNERSAVTMEMRRNLALYEDKHWETFATNKRPDWKMPGVVNYMAWIADTKSALMADNKPKASFTTPRIEDNYQAEILNAAWDEWWEEERCQAKLEVACKLSIIRKVAYLKLDYDPNARGGKGGITCRVIDGISVYVNAEATTLDDAEVVLHEYTLPLGETLGKWPKLKGDRLIYSGYDTEAEDEAQANEGTSSGESHIQPAQNYVDPSGTLKHTPPYGAPDARADYERDSRRCLIREVWTRPKGPKYEVDVEEIQFTVTGEIITERKYIEFSDGHLEPLQTVVMANGIVYELPMSTVHVLQYAADVLGGIGVDHVEDTLVAKLKKKRVPLYPTGRRMIGVGNVIADDGANPFAHGRIGLVKLPERPAVKYYPRCSIDRGVSLQNCLNRIVSMIFDAAHLTANPLWRMPINSEIADEEITNAPGAIQREDPLSLKIGKRERGPDMPAYVMSFVTFLISQIRTLSGLEEQATGGKFKGQQAAETVSMYQEAAGIAFRPSLRCVEQAIIEVGMQFRGMVGQFYTQERLVHFKTEAGVETHKSYIGTRLTANMAMRVKAGSMLPTSPSARLNYVIQLLQTPAMDVPELLRNLEEVGIIDSASRMLKRLTQERMDPRRQWMLPGLNPAGGKKKKPKSNAGRSARGTTPQGAASKS